LEADPTEANSTPDAPLGEWVDLLEWTVGFDWAPRGINWNDRCERPPTKDAVTLKQLPFMQFPLPAIIDGDYEMEVEFTRHDGIEGVCIVFPVGIHNMHLEFGGFKGSVSGVSWINGKHYNDNPTARRPAPLSNNQKHRVLIRVRRNGERAAFNIDLDDTRDYITWEGPYAALTNVDRGPWNLTMVRHPWIGSYENRTTFHKVRVRMISGVVQRDLIDAADRQRDLQNGLVRLVGQPAKEATVGFARFLVNQIPQEAHRPGECERDWPLITRDFSICQDFYGAHAPSRLKCPIPKFAKSFSAIGFNHSSKTVKYLVFIDGKQIFDSGVTGIGLVKLNIPPNSSLLELVVDPAGDHSWDHSYWCYPRFHTGPIDELTDTMLEGPASPLKLVIASHSIGAHTFTHNQPIGTLKSVPIHIRDAQPCDEFLVAHANSSVTYAVPAAMNRFTAIGYNVMSHSVKFQVWADAKRIYESPQAGIVAIDVRLPPGTKTIQLKVDGLVDTRFDHSIWCYPRLHTN
jgi:hypothetical protein